MSTIQQVAQQSAGQVLLTASGSSLEISSCATKVRLIDNGIYDEWTSIMDFAFTRETLSTLWVNFNTPMIQ